MQYTNFYSYEQITSGDLSTGFQNSMTNINAFIQQGLFTSSSNIFLSGLQISASTLNTYSVTCSAGQGWQNGQSLAVGVTQTLNILSGSPGTNTWGSGLAAGSEPRIDLCIVQYQGTPSDPAQRNFENPSTGAVYAQTINTATVDGFAFNVIHGAASSNPVAPSTPSGWIALAQVYVDANATSITSSNITDLTVNYRISGGALGNVSGQAFYRNDSGLNSAPIFNFINNTTLNIGAGSWYDNTGLGTSDITGAANGLRLLSSTLINADLQIGAGNTFTNNGSYAGSPIVTSLAGTGGVTVANPSTPGVATIGLSGVPNSNLSGPLVNSITVGDGLSITNPTGIGASSLGLVVTGGSLGLSSSGLGLVLNGTSLQTSSTGLAINFANNNTWTGEQTYSGIAVFEGSLGLGLGNNWSLGSTGAWPQNPGFVYSGSTPSTGASADAVIFGYSATASGSWVSLQVDGGLQLGTSNTNDPGQGNLVVDNQATISGLIVTNTATISGLLSLADGATGTGTLGTLEAGTGILGTANTWTASQAFPELSVGTSGTTGFITTDVTASNSWFGLYNAGNDLYYGIFAGLPAPAGVTGLGGYYNGVAVGGSSNATGTPIFGVLTSTQSSEGVGNTAFGVTDSNVVTTFNNTVDNGSGESTTSGLATFEAGITGTGTLGTLTAGTGILGTSNTWTANQTFSGEVVLDGSLSGTVPVVTSITAGDGITVDNPTGVGAATVTATLNGTTLLNSASGLSVNLANANTWTGVQTLNSPVLSGTTTVNGTLSGGTVNPASGTVAGSWAMGGGARFWTTDSNGLVFFMGADTYSTYGDQISDIGLNVTQQDHSGGLPAPNSAYGGGLFRFDLRSNNPSTLPGLGGTAQWYILLQPSGTAGSGNPFFGVDSNGAVASSHSTFDDGSGAATIGGLLTANGNLALPSTTPDTAAGVVSQSGNQLYIGNGSTAIGVLQAGGGIEVEIASLFDAGTGTPLTTATGEYTVEEILLDNVSGFVSGYFEAMLYSSTGTTTAYAELQNLTASTTLATVSTTNTSETILRSGSFTLTTGTYSVYLANNGTGDDVYLLKGRIVGVM